MGIFISILTILSAGLMYALQRPTVPFRAVSFSRLATMMNALRIIFGACASYLLADNVSRSTGWFYWLVIIGLFFVSILVLHAPYNLHTLISSIRLHNMGGIGRMVSSVTPLSVFIFQFTPFVIVPIGIMGWAISLSF